MFYQELINKMKVLYIGANWPQPSVTAAGVRTIGLIQALKALGASVNFISIKKVNKYQTKDIEAQEIPFAYCPPNNPEEFQKHTDAEVCIFETARLEEMFGHMIYYMNNKCKRVIDTQDLHSLRLTRQELVNTGTTPSAVVESQLDFKQDFIAREFACFMRSHASILTSAYEQKLVAEYFPFIHTQVIPFLYPNSLITKNKSWFSNPLKKSDFVWIGNFQHPPNKHAVDHLVHNIWPEIYSKTKAQLHIYGANFPQTHNWYQEGVRVEGQMKSIEELKRFKVLLAPIQFGAGIKGKITDSFLHGVGVVTTSIGAEGIDPFPGRVSDTNQEFIEKAVDLYSDSKALERCISEGFTYLQKNCGFSQNKTKLKKLIENLEYHPLQDILMNEAYRSTFYFSKFVEYKEKLKT